MIIKNLDNELLIAKQASKIAGDVLKNSNKFLKKELLSTKRDIKLNADIIAEKSIKDFISAKSQFPILAEESVDSFNEMPDTFWVIDPLDGTANYSREIPLYCISLAIISHSKPILGVIYDFHNDDLYEGSINTKAYMNKREISVSNTRSSCEGILMTGLPNDTDYSDEALFTMVKNFQNWRKVRMIGSAALASVYVASGRADLYMEKKSYLWDIAAGAAIVNAAGGEALILNQNEKFQVDVRFSNSLINT